MINVVVTLPETGGLLFLCHFILHRMLLKCTTAFYEAFPSLQEGLGVVKRMLLRSI